MSRKAVHRAAPSTAPLPPQMEIRLQEFSRRLFQAMQEKGWTQSDLAREAFGATTDQRGYKVARNRDRVSVYLRGKSVPDPKNLKLLADALGTTPEELAPDLYANSHAMHERPEISINAVAGHPDQVHLMVNKIVKLTVASQVFALLAACES